MRRWVLFMTVALSALVLAACGTDDPEDIIDDIIDDGEITVHFDTLGGPSVESQTIDMTDPDLIVPTPERDGYLFNGWYLSESFDEAFNLDDFSFDDDITLYAHWLAVFTVTFRSDDGSEIDSVDVVEGETIEAIDAPAKTQAVFEAWVTDYTTLTPFDFDAPITENTDIYGYWLSIFTVNYRADGDIIDSVEVLEGETIDLPEGPQKEGYTFLHWSMSEGLDNPFDDTEGVQASMTLYAYYEANEYTISFETYDADDIPDLVAQYSSVISAPALPELDDYHFIGWYLDEDFTEPFLFDTMPLGDITLYARFIPLGAINTITFYVDGAVYDEFTVYDGEFLTLPDDPEKPGYTFIEWETLDGPLDPDEPIFNHMNITAVFEPNNYTIHFEGDLADSILAPFESPISAPADPEKDGYVFIGWYLDEAHTEPFVFDTMPLGGANLYARFVEEDTALRIADIIVMRPETAELDNMVVVFSEYMEFQNVHITLLSDGTHAIVMMGDLGVPLGHRVSFEATFIYEGDVPIVAGWDSLEDHGLDAEFTMEYETMSLDELFAFEATPYTIGTPIEVTGLLYRDIGEIAFIDGLSDRFFPLFNVMMSDVYDAEFDALEHFYVTIRVLTFLPFEDEGLALLYVDDPSVEAISLTGEEKATILQAFLQNIYDHRDLYPGDRLDIDGIEPFFGYTVSVDAIGEHADLYDADTDSIRWVEEDAIITFQITLENGTTETFEIDITVKQLPTVGVMDGATLEEGIIDVVVLYVGDRYIFVQDYTGAIAIEHYGALDVEAGDRVILDVQFAPVGPMTLGFSPFLVRELGTAEGDMPSMDVGIDDLASMIHFPHGIFATTLEGLLIPGEGAHPFAIYADGVVVHLTMSALADNYDDFLEMLYTNVEIDLIIASYWIMEPEGYIGYFDGNMDNITSTPLDNASAFAIAQGWLEAIDMPLRPGETLDLINEFPMFNMAVDYDSDSSFIDLDEGDRGLRLTALEEGVALLEVILSIDDDEHTFTLEIHIEDYDLSSIAYAKALPEGTTVTLRVDVVATTAFAHHYVLADETGIVFLNANTVSQWFMFGDTLIITGELADIDGVTWLENAVFETYADGEPAGMPAVDVVDADDYFTREDFTEGIEYIEIEGLLDYANGQLSLIWLDDETKWLTLGVDPGDSTLWPFIGEVVTLRGVVFTDQDFNTNILAFVERVVTEYDGTIDGLYEEADGTLVWMEAYLLAYENEVLFVSDGTGVMEVHGIVEAFALNRIGDRATLYLTLRHEGGMTYLESHGWYSFNYRQSVDPEGYIPVPIDVDIKAIYGLDTTANDLANTVYRVSGTLREIDDALYLEDDDQFIRITDLVGWMPDWAPMIDQTVELTLIMTRDTTEDGAPIMVFVPYAPED